MPYARYIYINGRRADQTCKSCTFDWNKDVGCSSATLTFPGADFDDFLNMAYGDKVDIRFGTSKSTRWWLGTIASLDTNLVGGLTIQCQGMYAFLDEVKPKGRFGYLVETAVPANLAADADSAGGAIPAGTYDYKITSVDESGETAASSAVTVTLSGSTSSVEMSWDAAQGAKGYRLYRKKSTDTDWVYWTVSETSFTDTNGTTGATITAPPSASTAETPTISSTKIDDVVDYLLDTYLPTELTKGTISAGSTIDLDDYDLSQSSGTLREVLQTLAKMANDAICYVDQDGAVQFVARGNPDTDTVPSKHRFGVGRSGGDLIGSVSAASRSRSVDGASDYLVEGEDALNDAEESEGDLSADSLDDIDDGTISINVKYYTLAKFFCMRLIATNATAIWGSIESLDLISPVSSDFFLSAGVRKPMAGDLKKYAQTFPGIYRLWRMYQHPSRVDSNLTIAVLDYTNKQIAKVRNLRYDSEVTYDDTGIRLASSSRSRPFFDYAPGVKTMRSATMVAAANAGKTPVLVDRFTIGISDVTQLVKPGVDIVQFTTQRGTSYKLSVNGASYVFADAPSLTLDCGDNENDPKRETEAVKKQVARLTERSQFKAVWRPANSSILIP